MGERSHPETGGNDCRRDLSNQDRSLANLPAFSKSIFRTVRFLFSGRGDFRESGVLVSMPDSLAHLFSRDCVAHYSYHSFIHAFQKS